MSVAMDVLGLEETGWKVKTSRRFLMRAAAGVAIGGGRIEVLLGTPDGGSVTVKGQVAGLGVGSGGAKDLSGASRDFIRSLVKYASLFKVASVTSNVYRYRPFIAQDNPDQLRTISVDELRQCSLVLTTLSTAAGVFGGALDYYAFYRRAQKDMPAWVWFAAGTI